MLLGKEEMRIAFFCQTPGVHLDMAQHLIKSARKVMPGVEIFHLTNGECEAAPNVDGVIRLGGKIPMAIRRMRLHSMLAGEWLFVDSDIVIQKDVRPVFKDGFEVAVTDRVGSAWEHSEAVKDMPYNMGVTFSRCPAFWSRAAKLLEHAPEPLKEWCGDQFIVCELTKHYRTKVLPGQLFNFTPLKRGEDRSHAAIVHYKGPRKEWVND